MRLDDFLASHGLRADPFAQTNAEEEELLYEYFVPPPYFESILGSPEKPKSTVVFAPRGGGKTAQRRMLEEDSRRADAGYLCVLYDRFAVGKSSRPSTDDHLNQLCHRILLGLLVELELREVTGDGLYSEDREFLTNEASLLDAVDAETFDALVRSLKSDARRMGDWARDHSGPVKAVVAGLLKKRGIELDPTLPWGPQMTKAKETPPIQRLRRLIDVAQTLDFHSVYVLVDRLDETATTNTNPERAIELVADLVLDLTVMELPGLAIKVFAWDLAQDHYHNLGGRRDRVKEFKLAWGLPALSSMMSRRLQAFSGGGFSSLNSLVAPDVDIDLHGLACYIAHSSPRDMIRFCAHVIDQHLNSSATDHLLTEADIWLGLKIFSAEIADERGKKFLPDLLRLDRYRFTQNRVATEYLKISKQAVGGKVSDWRRTGMIAKVSEVQDARARPQHLYGVADPRLAVFLRPGHEPREVLEFYSLVCSQCGVVNFWDDQGDCTCIGCLRELEPARVSSVMSLCLRTAPPP